MGRILKQCDVAENKSRLPHDQGLHRRYEKALEILGRGPQ